MASKLTTAQHADLTAALASGDITGQPRPVLIFLLEMVRKALDTQYPALAGAIDAGFDFLEKLLGGTTP